MATPPEGAQGQPQGEPQGPPGPRPQGQAVPIPIPAGMNLQPGQRPSPEQIQEIQRRIASDAQKAGLTVPQFLEQLKKQAAEQQARMRAAQAAGQPIQGPGGQMMQGRPMPPGAMRPQGKAMPSGPPSPAGLAVAKFLRNQDLKTRTCILNGERKDLFKVKRALRALESPAYAKARKKNPLLPEIKDRASLENTFKLLPLGMLALRVSKVDPQAGPGGKKPKRVKGQWTVAIEKQQDAKEDMYYVWLFEGSQMKRQVYAALALLVIFIIVLYPLWPLKLRLGVYYLSWGLMGLLGLFFLMAIFRVILFCVTYFVTPPGLWLYPNLWEDVSFMDSFRPVWAWHETTKPKKKKKKSVAGAANATVAAATGQVPAEATTTGTDTAIAPASETTQRYVAPKVEEDEE